MYKFWKIASLSIALIFVAKPAMASVTCITSSEMDALLIISAPTVLKVVKQKCKIVLSKDAYLIQNNESILAKFEANRDASRSLAAKAVLKIMLSQSLNKTQVESLRAMPSDSILELWQNGISTSLKVDANSCLVGNESMELLDPLPPQNMTKGLTLLMQAGFNSVSKKQQISFPLCPYKPSQSQR